MHGSRRKNVKITYNGGLGRETEIDFALAGRRDRKHIKNLKSILGEYQLKLLVIDLDGRSIKKKVKSYRSVKKRVWKLEEVEYRREFMIWLIQIIKIYGTFLEVEFGRLLMKCVV